MSKTMDCNVCHNPVASADGPCPACLSALIASGQSPPAGLPERVWVLCVRTEAQFSFITINERLVLFATRGDALHSLATLVAQGCLMDGVGVEEVLSKTCWAYAVLKGLTLSRAERKFDAERN